MERPEPGTSSTILPKAKMMTCLECGSTMRTRRELVPFEKPIGLPGVRLSTLVTRCPKCGAFEVMLPDLEGLHRLIARALVGKKARLAPAEIRFLRKVFRAETHGGA